MCAINGIAGSVENAAVLLRRMNEATKHRGPDGSALWNGREVGAGDVCFGHNRLAIIDLTAAADQPMVSNSGRYTIVFNGEIYNYLELRESISGYEWRSKGDTEVILVLFEKEGIAAFEKLRGMFACAIWDRETKTLTIARDGIGVKPLYYAITHDSLVFSSEVKGILASGLFLHKIDHDSLRAYLRLRYVPEPRTMIEGVHKLPPGTWMQFKCGAEAKKGNFAAIPLSAKYTGTFADAAQEVERLVDASVRAELVSDRPLGVFLSGGLDSTIVLDAATRVHSGMETFSLRFEVTDAEQSEKFNADANLAKETAQFYQSRHHEIIFNEKDFLASIPEAMRYLDQPVANATALAQLHLARKTREHVVVALAGEGGDEVFGGYPRYRTSRMMDIYQRVPRPVRDILSSTNDRFRLLSTPAGIARIALFEFEKDKVLRSIITSDFLSTEPDKEFEDKYLSGRKEPDFTALFMDADRRSWLVDEALQRADTMNMAAGIESRVPLLNLDLVRFGTTLPSSWRAGLQQNKKVLRAAFAHRLPPHVSHAPKRGFFSPTAKWIRRPAVLSFIREVLSPGYHHGTDGLFNFEEVKKMLDQHVSGERYALSTLWTLVTLRVWAKELEVSLEI